MAIEESELAQQQKFSSGGDGVPKFIRQRCKHSTRVWEALTFSTFSKSNILEKLR
jgi:hypothetical protein